MENKTFDKKPIIISQKHRVLQLLFEINFILYNT